jgi:A/G-specific adenine glycosylase
MQPDPDKLRFVRERLLRWYERNGRDYPWRRTRDPYRILIAEIMLQRTKADQVVPVYEEFMKRFPDPVSLREADAEVIRSFFSRLGLMWRADLIKKFAAALSERFGGRIPSERDQLLSLPAVGDYMADAVLSFAFGRNVAVVDSNVCRVLRRLFGLRPRGEARRDKLVREIAQRLVPPERAREFNWAMIDFAAAVCTPRNPKCDICPLKEMCSHASVGD